MKIVEASLFSTDSILTALPIVERKIASEQARFILDTGEGISILSPAFAGKLRERREINFSPSNLVIRCVTGSECPTKWMCDAPLALNRFQGNHPLYVTVSPLYDCIIGYDLVSKHGLLIDSKHGILRRPADPIDRPDDGAACGTKPWGRIAKNRTIHK